MKKKLVQIVVGTAVIVLLAGGFLVHNKRSEVQAIEDNRPVVTIAYLPTTHSLALLEQAKLQQDNPDYKMELVKYGTWPDLTDALNAGKVDGAVELTELGMQANANGIDLQAVALGHRDGNIVVTAKNIGSVSDLKGKTFAIPSKLSSHNLLLNQMLQENGISLNDVNIVELSPSEMPFALVSGQIAGYCVAEPFGAKAIHADVANVLYESGELWENSICCALVFRTSFLENNADIADKVIKDYKEAGAFLEENQEEAVKTGEEYLSVEKEVLSVSLQWISFMDLNITQTAYEDLCDKLVQDEIMEKTPIYEKFVAVEYNQAEEIRE